jgi:hypothetical protein
VVSVEFLAYRFNISGSCIQPGRQKAWPEKETWNTAHSRKGRLWWSPKECEEFPLLLQVKLEAMVSPAGQLKFCKWCLLPLVMTRDTSMQWVYETDSCCSCSWAEIRLPWVSLRSYTSQTAEGALWARPFLGALPSPRLRLKITGSERQEAGVRGWILLKCSWIQVV